MPGMFGSMGGYDPGPGPANPYAAQGWGDPNTIGRNIWQDNPNAAYANFLNQYGIGQGQTPFARWAADPQQRERAYNMYQAYTTTPEGFNTDYVDFLKNYGGSLSQQWAAQPPRQQGYQAYGGMGRVHWSGI